MAYTATLGGGGWIVGPIIAGGSFSAHNNAVTQDVPTATFTKLTFSTEVFNLGGYYANSRFTPPAGAPVLLIGGANCPVLDTSKLLLSIYKNGVEFRRGVQLLGSASDTGGVQAVCTDVPNGTDYYELFVFQASGVTQAFSGAPGLTYFQGTTLRQ
jgi:hypothetical protein